MGRFWGGVGKVLKPSGRAVGDVVLWLRCWMPKRSWALRCPVVVRVLEEVSTGLPPGFMALATQHEKSRGPRRVGEPQAQPQPSQATLHCRGIWGGFVGMSPHGGTAQPFSLWLLGTLGHNRQHCWGTDGTRHGTDGSVPDRQPRGRGPLALGCSLGSPSAGWWRWPEGNRHHQL